MRSPALMVTSQSAVARLEAAAADAKVSTVEHYAAGQGKRIDREVVADRRSGRVPVDASWVGQLRETPGSFAAANRPSKGASRVRGGVTIVVADDPSQGRLGRSDR